MFESFRPPVFLLISSLAAPLMAQQINLTFGPGTDADKALITRAVADANTFFRSQFGVVATPVTIDVSSSPGPNAAAALANPGKINFYTGTDGWFNVANAFKYKIVFHEMFHVLQFQLAKGSLRSDSWLTEGSAEYVGYRGADAFGQYSFGLAKSFAIERARPLTVPLAQQKSSDPGSYSAGFVAVDQLVGQAGLSSLAEFYRLGGDPSAFQRVYAKQLGQFYSEYEGLRSTILASPQATMTFLSLLPPDYNPQSNYLQFAFKLVGIGVQQARTCQCPPQSFVGSDANYDLIVFLHNSNPPGRYTFTWQNPGGTALAGSFDKPSTSVQNSVPVVISLGRNSATEGEAGFLLSVTGSNFSPGVSASWNNAARPVILLSPTQLQVAITALDLAVPGTIQIRVANQPPGGGPSTPTSFTVAARTDRPTVSSARSVGNAASYFSSQVSPGEILTIFGTNLGSNDLAGLKLDSDGTVGTSLSGTRVLFDGVPGPLIYVRADQLSVIVPYSAGRTAIAGNTLLQIERNGIRSEALQIPVAATLPALFTANSSGSGQAAALNQDGTSNSASSAAPKGSVVVFFGTGEGDTTPSGIDGLVANSTFPKPILPVSVRVGDVLAEVLYAGAAPGLVSGVFQLNVRIPNTATIGDLPVTLTVGQVVSRQDITVAVK